VEAIAANGFDDWNGVGGWFEWVAIVEGAWFAFSSEKTVSETFKIVDGDEITGCVR
jgi:hypothetical protein